MTVWVRVPPRLRMEYICDTKRHLICVPYSIENLHKMAEELKIKRCWFHKNHYDIPKKRIEEITMKCRVVSSKEIVEIINTSLQLNGRVAPRIVGWSRFDSWQRYKISSCRIMAIIPSWYDGDSSSTLDFCSTKCPDDGMVDIPV